ncbi:hypothetical protein ABZ599_32710 [Streptomyces misionensis]|uniref:hypothetical protein n=1 Tax=Streptomyces misionensis TaxID=67331 RepID=UPI0033C8C7BB
MLSAADLVNGGQGLDARLSRLGQLFGRLHLPDQTPLLGASRTPSGELRLRDILRGELAFLSGPLLGLPVLVLLV